MIKTTLPKNILRSILRRNQGLQDHQMMHPLREWFNTLLLGTIALSAGIFISITLYREYSDFKPSTENQDTISTMIYRDLEIKRALTEFSERKKVYTELRNKLLSSVPAKIPVTTETISEAEPVEVTLPNEPSTLLEPRTEMIDDAPTPETF